MSKTCVIVIVTVIVIVIVPDSDVCRKVNESLSVMMKPETFHSMNPRVRFD